MKYFFSVLCAAQILILFSCTSHQDALEIKENRYFISVLQKGTLTPQHFLSYDEVAPYAETIEKYAGFILKDLTAETVIINYRTTDFYGNPIVASGSIVYTIWPNEVRMTFRISGYCARIKKWRSIRNFSKSHGITGFLRVYNSYTGFDWLRSDNRLRTSFPDARNHREGSSRFQTGG